MKKYQLYETVTREVLDSIKVGDLVRVNNWRVGNKVVGVSENFIATTVKEFGQLFYSVIEKRPSNVTQSNRLTGYYSAGPDWWCFGWKASKYLWDDESWVKSYLESWESGETEFSRRAISIKSISIKQ